MRVRTRAMAVVLGTIIATGGAIINAGQAAAAIHYDCMVGETRMERYQNLRDDALERGDTNAAIYWDNKGAQELAKYTAASC